MGEDASTDRATVNETRDPEELRSEIADTRRELGETVAALSAKTDVKAQARERIEDVKAGVAQKKDELTAKAKGVSPDSAVSVASAGAEKARQNPLPLAVAGAFAAGFLLGRLTSRE